MKRPSGCVFVFVDGVGLGAEGPHNPLSLLRLPALERLAGGQPWTSALHAVRTDTHQFVRLDATLGVEGLPQSGTGQASLFTGENCARLAGRHFGPFPHSTSKPLLSARNVFEQLREGVDEESEPFAFANPFPERYLRMAESRQRWSVTTFCCKASGVRLRTEADWAARRAVPADLTGARWPGDAPARFDEAESGRILAELAREHRLTLFEFWLTDKAGHGRGGLDPGAVLRSLDRCLGALLDAIDPITTLLLLTSDHGNIEDLSTRSHTRNPVPLVAWGQGADAFAEASALTDVLPGLRSALGATV